MPKPPGTRIPSAASSREVISSLRRVSASTHIDLELAPVMDGRVSQRFDHAQIGVLKLHVLAHQGDAHRTRGLLDPVDQLDPLVQLQRAGLQFELVDHQPVEPLIAQVQRDEVDVGRVDTTDHRPRLHVGEESDLVLQLLADGAVGAAHDDVRLDTDAAQLVDAVLGGLGLQFAAGVDEGDERHVDVDDVLASDVLAELADGFEERQALDVPHRAPDLGDDHVHVGVAGHAGDAFLDLVGDMGDDLDRAAEIVALALLADDVVVDGARGDVGVAGEALVDEALVVTEVEVGLRSVVGDEDLAMLERTHGAGVDVEVGVELLDADLQPAALQETAQRRAGYPLAER